MATTCGSFVPNVTNPALSSLQARALSIGQCGHLHSTPNWTNKGRDKKRDVRPRQNELRPIENKVCNPAFLPQRSEFGLSEEHHPEK